MRRIQPDEINSAQLNVGQAEAAQLLFDVAKRQTSRKCFYCGELEPETRDDLGNLMCLECAKRGW